VGHLLPVTVLMRLQRAGHRPIALVGGGTGLVGDPSGKENERPMLDLDTLAANVAGLRSQLARFLNFEGPAAARLENNADWLTKVPLTTFLRDVGKHFSVNAMLARDSVKRRIEDREQGISYTEFSYMLLQAYDFLELHDRFGCTMQIGGSDQWGNIVSGCDLIRRTRGAESHGLTVPLVTRSDGKKFGKSEGGNIWLDPERTTPFEFFQYFLNLADDDVGTLLRRFTFVEVAEIAEIEAAHFADPGKRAGQKRLAEEMTRLVHGEAGVLRAAQATAVLFGGDDLRGFGAQALRDAFGSAPRLDVSADRLAGEGLKLVEALAESGLCGSRGEARKQVQSGGVSVNQQKISDIEHVLTSADVLDGGFVVLRRGKKSYHLLHVG
jgi:tyrosyl-tRNA synthetase